MRDGQISQFTTWGLLGSAALASFLLPGTLTVPSNVAAGLEPATLELNGVLRDFHKNDPIIDGGGASGHYAGNVMDLLPGNNRPLFASDGYEVSSEYLDSSGRAIAPHLALVRGRRAGATLGLKVTGSIDIKKGGIDAFNSNFGPYGLDGNYGADALVSTNSTAADDVKVESGGVIRGDVVVGVGGSPTTVIDNQGIITGSMTAQTAGYVMPTIIVPTDPDDLEDHEVEEHIFNDMVTLKGDVTPDDDTDEPALWYDRFRITNSIVTIEGDLRIRCDELFEVTNSQIVLLEDANLTIYVQGGDDIQLKSAQINVDPGDTSMVAINYLGNGKIKVDDVSHVYATIMAPSGHLDIHKGHVYGAFIGKSMKLHHHESGVHVDSANAEVGAWNFALTVREEIKLEEGSVIDSFDSDDGPYGGPNIGQAALVSTNRIKKQEKVHLKQASVIQGDVLIGPEGDIDKVVKLEGGSVIEGAVGRLTEPIAIPVVAPPLIGVSVGDLEYVGQTFTLSANMRCHKLKLDGSTMNVSGNVTIRCDDKIELKHNSHINILPDSTLTVYVKKDFKLEDGCTANANTGDPTVFSLRRTSVGKKGKVEVKKGSRLCARVQGAKTELKLEDGSEFFGSFIGRKVKMKDSAFHVDMAGLLTCVDTNDTEGVAGLPGHGGIASADAFDQWYRNVLGVNQATGYPITLTQNVDGVYELLSDNFHPADDRLFGNEGEDHNNYFTYAIHGEFTFVECGGQFVEFTGGDGMWLFVNGQLAMDLGGVGADVGQYLEIDRLGLVDGETYEIALFYAQRRSTESVFRLRTNLDISTSGALPSVTAMFD